MEDVTFATTPAKSMQSWQSSRENQSSPPQNLTTDGNGKMLESAEEAVGIWLDFLSGKFKTTDKELLRISINIPKYRSPTSVLTRKEFDEAIKRMSNNKVAGPDGIPFEAIKYCPMVSETLFQITNTMWELETIPDGFVKANFVMFFKKGSADDPANYRCIV